MKYYIIYDDIETIVPVDHAIITRAREFICIDGLKKEFHYTKNYQDVELAKKKFAEIILLLNDKDIKTIFIK